MEQMSTAGGKATSLSRLSISNGLLTHDGLSKVALLLSTAGLGQLEDGNYIVPSTKDRQQGSREWCVPVLINVERVLRRWK